MQQSNQLYTMMKPTIALLDKASWTYYDFRQKENLFQKTSIIDNGYSKRNFHISSS